MPLLVDPVALAGRTAPSRVLFGPHETNLGRDRSIGDRHVAYYAARAAGGCGVVVTETASAHASDWPYERAPLASASGPGWAAVAAACHPHGALVLAGIGHCGAQGSSAYSQAALWAPSGVADAVSREMPMVMEDGDVAALVEGFGEAAGLVTSSGLDGVEVDAGPRSLLRQFHSGLTNQRTDGYGEDRLRLTREVLAATRAGMGEGRVLGLRLSCDELAPWAGVTPDQATAQVAELAPLVDLLVVVRGGPFSTTAYRPDGHTPPLCNVELCRAMREAAGGRVPVVLQGSVTDPAAAQNALDDGVCDLVEMTRAQIADARLVELVRAGRSERVRPCILCNQACQVRDPRNPIVSCIGEPRSGHETADPDAGPHVVVPLGPFSPGPALPGPASPGPASPGPASPGTVRGGNRGPSPEGTTRAALVVGAGVAGLECARMLAQAGFAVRLVDRSVQVGGMLRTAARLPGHRPAAALVEWLSAECSAYGVTLEAGHEVSDAEIDAALARSAPVVLATGSRPAPYAVPVDSTAAVLDAPELLEANAAAPLHGPVLVHDPVGGPVGVGIAEWLATKGGDVALVTPDQVAGSQLSMTGDLADANVRLQRLGVRRELRTLIRSVEDGSALLEHVWTGQQHRVPCVAVVDCGHRLPEDRLALTRPGLPRAGDCVAPRTALEAVLEGRRRALELIADEAARRVAS